MSSSWGLSWRSVTRMRIMYLTVGRGGYSKGPAAMRMVAGIMGGNWELRMMWEEW